MNRSLAKKLYWNAFLAARMIGDTRYPFRPRRWILRDQARNVRAITAYACRNVPYYRDTVKRLGLEPSDFRGVEDLARLPILEKAAVISDPARFVSTAVPEDRQVEYTSSGSTGQVLKFREDLESTLLRSVHEARARAVFLGLLDRRHGFRVTSIAMPNAPSLRSFRIVHEQTGLSGWQESRQQRLSVLDPPERNLPLINRFKPDIVFTYGSYLSMLFEFLESTGQAIHPPRAFVYGADSLPEPIRRLIESQYGVPVFGRYQAVEAPRLGFECERHTGYHLNIDLYPVRIVDERGQTAPAGETGEVVVSNLVNRGTVLLNYRLGDLASLETRSCPCGRTLPLLSFHLGRTDDILVLPGGGSLHPTAVKRMMIAEPVSQYQVVQHAPARYSVLAVPLAGADPAAVRRNLEAKFRERFGPGVALEVRLVDGIERTRAGKYRAVISEVKRG